jgi:hypothetical protein
VRQGVRLTEVPMIFVERRVGVSENGFRTVVRTMLAVLAMRVRR